MSCKDYLERQFTNVGGTNGNAIFAQVYPNLMLLETADRYPYYFNRMMSIYQYAQVDYVSYKVRFTDLGFTNVAVTEPATTGQFLYGGWKFTTGFISVSDNQTYITTPAVNEDNATQALVQVRGAKQSLTHSRGNRDTVTHLHALDMAAWYKMPFSTERMFTSVFATTPPANPTWSPNIIAPAGTQQDPVLQFVMECNSDAGTYNCAIIVEVEYHVTLSRPHMPAYGPAFQA